MSRKPRYLWPKDPRYVYIMKRTKRGKYAKLTGQNEYKIGIAKTPEQRRKAVSNALKRNKKGGAVLIAQYYVPNARALEAYLHRTFDNSNFNIRAGKGAGNTEWFYMSDKVLASLQALLFLKWFEAQAKYVIAVLFLITVLLITITNAGKEIPNGLRLWTPDNGRGVLRPKDKKVRLIQRDQERRNEVRGFELQP